MSSSINPVMSSLMKWRLGVYFGSVSDRKVAEPLVEYLKAAGFDVDLHFISAHRNAAELTRHLKAHAAASEPGDFYDAYIAGAGLAAHLPGVIASQTNRPVFGVPVNGAFGGLDAVLSIVQMPAGVPVLTCGSEKTGAIVDYLSRATGFAGRGIHVCHSGMGGHPSFASELQRTQSFAADAGIEFTHGPEIIEGAINIKLVDIMRTDRDLADGAVKFADLKDAICVPWMSEAEKTNPESAIILSRIMTLGGIWVGVNNLRNALVAASRISSMRKVLARVYRGSVKDVLRSDDPGTLLFEYSDRYSVFDWGPMPDEISGKGEALAFIADSIFRHVRARHHSKGLLRHGGRCLAVQEIQVKRPTRIADGAWDYSAYEDSPVDCLVPLEVIFRFAVPEGSSLPGRLRANPEWLGDLGLESVPATGTVFDKPVVEFSTKLEDSDRYVTRAEARKIASMTQTEFSRLESRALQIAIEIRELFQRAGLDLQDGKLEFAFAAPECGASDRDFILVDSVGPDELRLTHDGVQISKEILRQFYIGGRWHEAVGEAKKLAKERTTDWKAICRNDLAATPERLTPDVADIAAHIYPSIANSLARAFGERIPFPAAWDLSQLVGRVREAGLA